MPSEVVEAGRTHYKRAPAEVVVTVERMAVCWDLSQGQLTASPGIDPDWDCMHHTAPVQVRVHSQREQLAVAARFAVSLIVLAVQVVVQLVAPEEALVLAKE